MGVFSLLKFWRTADSGDLIPAEDFNSLIDNNDSFFDLVFTSLGDDDRNVNVIRIKFDVRDSKTSFGISSLDDYSNNKRRILPLNSLNTKTLQSSLRLLKQGFQHNQKSKLETGEVKIGVLLKQNNSLRHQLRTEKLLETDQAPSKRFSKDVINKYLNLMKSSYVAVLEL